MDFILKEIFFMNMEKKIRRNWLSLLEKTAQKLLNGTN